MTELGWKPFVDNVTGKSLGLAVSYLCSSDKLIWESAFTSLSMLALNHDRKGVD